ncbi:Non-specific lipid-transfer protein 1-like protein [Drosera capensis]
MRTTVQYLTSLLYKPVLFQPGTITGHTQSEKLANQVNSLIMQSKKAFAMLHSMVVVVMALWLLLVVGSRPASGAFCFNPTTYLDNCKNFLQYGDDVYLRWPFVPLLVETCCDKIADLKLKYAQLTSTFDRQNLCECLRQECLNNKVYNWDRMDSIPQKCDTGPVGFTVSRTVDCNEVVQ